MMRGKYFLLVYGLLGVALGVDAEEDQAHGVSVLESSHTELICSEQGVVKYKLFTNKAVRYENGDCTYPEGMQIEFYASESQEVSMTGRANSVYFCYEKNVYEFRGDVELKNLRDTRQLNTEELNWSPDYEVFYTDKFIRIETKEELLMGEGFTAKQDLSYYSIAKPQGMLNVK